LTSKIEKDTAEDSKLKSEIEAHTKDKAQTESALEQAAAVRAKEHASFVESDKMQKFSISQLDEAIPLIEGKASAAAFLQASPTHGSDLRRIISITNYVNADDKDRVLGFLESSSGEPSAGSAQIVGIMKAMRDEMAKDHKEMVEEEQNDNAAYNELKASKEEQLGVLMKTLADKEKRVGELAMSLSQDNDALEDAQEELDQGSRYLATLQEACEQRRKDRDMRAKMRDDEISAISEAVKILSDDEAMDTFRGVAKVQGGSALVQRDQPAAKESEENYGASFVQKSTKNVLKLLTKNKRPAGQVAKHASQAEKVVGFMIDNMVETLHNDDVNDEHKKDFCANETASFTQLQEDKEVQQAELEKSIEVMEGEIEELKADIKLLEEQINTNDQNVLKATKQRKEEHFTFAQEYQAMDTAVQLIDKAANRLNQFYNPKMSKAKALPQVQKSFTQTAYMADIQESSKQAPSVTAMAQEVTDSKEENYGASFVQIKDDSKVDPVVLPTTPKTYEKKESGGVLGLMNEMKTDLVTDMKESEMEEKHAQIDYVREMGEAKDQRAADVKTKTDKEAALATTEEKLLQAKQLNELTIEEIAQIKIYLTKLHIECDFLMRNFENRHESRVEEEVGLETAETIVTHDEPPSHSGTEKMYEEEHSKKQVEEHFPHDDLPVAGH
jgi:DNA repair exonuclease SbcCD ATPase subunit